MILPTSDLHPKQRDTSIPKFAGECPLVGYKGVSCGQGWHVHHWLRRGLVPDRRGMKEYLEDGRNKIWVCGVHNVQRWADQYEAVVMIFGDLILREGHVEMADFLDNLPWKIPHYEYSFWGLLSHLNSSKI